MGQTSKDNLCLCRVIPYLQTTIQQNSLLILSLLIPQLQLLKKLLGEDSTANSNIIRKPSKIAVHVMLVSIDF